MRSTLAQLELKAELARLDLRDLLIEAADMEILSDPLGDTRNVGRDKMPYRADNLQMEHLRPKDRLVNQNYNKWLADTYVDRLQEVL